MEGIFNENYLSEVQNYISIRPQKHIALDFGHVQPRDN